MRLAARHARVGDVEPALGLLELALAEHEWMLVYLRSDPDFAALRGNRRFESILQRIGFPGLTEPTQADSSPKTVNSATENHLLLLAGLSPSTRRGDSSSR